MTTLPRSGYAALLRRLARHPDEEVARQLAVLGSRGRLELHAGGSIALWSHDAGLRTPAGVRVQVNPARVFTALTGPGSLAASWLAVNPLDVTAVGGGEQPGEPVVLVVQAWTVVLRVTGEAPVAQRASTRIAALVQPVPVLLL